MVEKKVLKEGSFRSKHKTKVVHHETHHGVHHEAHHKVHPRSIPLHHEVHHESVPTSESVKEVVSNKPIKMVFNKENARPSTMQIVGEREMAYDFALKVYKKFDQLVKSIILFGSSAKGTSVPKSDIDIIVIIDDASVKWDEEMIAWYREELAKVVTANPYIKSLHINTVKLTTWWDDLKKGDPIILNVLRYGDALVDFGGFFNPLRILLYEGKIKSTPESIYTLLQRAPTHMTRAKNSALAVIDGLYWTMVDSAQALLIAADIDPVSPEHVSDSLMEHFVKKKILDKKFVYYYDELHGVAKEIIHGNITRVKGKDLDIWFENADSFLGEMARLVDEVVEAKRLEAGSGF